MKRAPILIVILSFLWLAGQAQISHGGEPLPLYLTKSGAEDWFEEMPAFDVEEELRIDSLNESDLRSGYRFAYKFMTDFSPHNSGTSLILPDGTRVWRLGIRSAGALSINVLFTEYELPEGACVFLYNKDQTHILGAFNHLNNSDLGILPVSPVLGDELIIEYREPSGVDFQGRLTVGEVNHAYRTLKGREPSDDNPDLHACMDPLSCYPEDPYINEKLGRSVVLLIINGISSCTGVMINNTNNDGTPYLLTASHCINSNFSITNPEGYTKRAESIISFFNYNSVLCDTVIRGTEELSMASTRIRAYNPNHDMALLELLEMPPPYYQPYYAGWNISEELTPPYFGIHHPNGSVKRIGWTEQQMQITSYFNSSVPLTSNAHWHISRWTAGCTSGGSSGSPLFDSQGKVLGSLTGGRSECDDPKNDYYYAISKVWDQYESGKQLKDFLNPGNTPRLSCEGLDPYATDRLSCFRLSNVQSNGSPDDTEVKYFPGSTTIPLFSNNNNGIFNYVEKYRVEQQAKLHGTYIVSPSTGAVNPQNLEVEVIVYSGDENGPSALLHRELFKPKFSDYDTTNGFTETDKPLNRLQESFVVFSSPVDISGTFYVGYRIVSAPENIYFTVLNLAASEQNTLWVSSTGTNWAKAEDQHGIRMKTSLFVDPVIQYTIVDRNSSVKPDEEEPLVIRSVDGRSIHVFMPEGTENTHLSVISMQGRVVTRQIISGQQALLSLPQMPPGIYLIHLKYAEKQHTLKLLF